MRLVPCDWVTHDTHDQTMVEVELWRLAWTLARPAVYTESHSTGCQAGPGLSSLSRPGPRPPLAPLT